MEIQKAVRLLKAEWKKYEEKEKEKDVSKLQRGETNGKTNKLC